MEGRKLLWVADGPFQQLAGEARQEAHRDLLFRSMGRVTCKLLSDLHGAFGGSLFELEPGDVGVVPPFRVHAAYNIEPTISINFTTCSQQQWAYSVAASVRMGIEVRIFYAREEAKTEDGEADEAALKAAAQSLLVQASAKAGRQQVGAYSAPFNKGFVSWIEQRISADIKLLNRDKVQAVAAMSRLTLVSRLLSGTGLDTVLSTGASMKWRKKMQVAVSSALGKHVGEGVGRC